jgi:hypothetical protein
MRECRGHVTQPREVDARWLHSAPPRRDDGAAQQLGAEAIVRIDLDYEVLGVTSSMLMVNASGTAVKLS